MLKNKINILKIIFYTSMIITHCQDNAPLPEFIWNFSFIKNSDKGLTTDFKNLLMNQEGLYHPSNYTNTKPSNILWVQCRKLSNFYHEVLPNLKHPFVLLISHGTETFPYECGDNFNIEDLLKNKLLIHVFAQNNAYQGPSKKVSHLPIGLDFHSIAYRPGGNHKETGSPKEQELRLTTLLKKLKPTNLRKKRAYVDFQLHDTMTRHFDSLGENRTTIFNQLIKTNLIDYGSRLSRSDLWKAKGEYAFSISPHGYGLDCHRTWEDLVLGCIVIVKTSPLDPLYEGLPVIIINNWSEVTPKNLDVWINKYSDAFTNPKYREKLYANYWINKIKLIANSHVL